MSGRLRSRITQSTSLFHIIFQSQASISTIVDNWIDLYKVNKQEALLQLMQFFIDSSGCKGKISDISYDYSAIIRELTENFNEIACEYPLIQNGPKLKKFRANFETFILVLIRGCENSILYDDYMMHNIIALLTGLTDSQVRAFRHTSTLAVMKIMTGLVATLKTVVSKKTISKRQLDNEVKKSQEHRNSQKIEHLESVLKEMEENSVEINEMLEFLFRGVFVLRFRDIVPEIRALCISEIGVWMEKLPQVFLDDSHLKYIGWSLNDKISEVRLKSLQSLKPLFEAPDLVSKMEFFICKFKDRVVSMTLDVDHSVAVEAMHLIAKIMEQFNSIFTDKDTENVYQLVFSDNIGVAHAAGEFLSNKLYESAQQEPKIKVKRNKSSNSVIIREVVDFFVEAELHEHAAYLVDSLIDTCDALKDWVCMTNILLDEGNTPEDTLTAKEESALIDIMVCSLKQCTTGVAPIGRDNAKKVKTLKYVRAMNEIKVRATELFRSVLPRLISKYESDHGNLLNLLQIPLYYDLDLFLIPSQNENVISLLKKIQIVFEKNHHTEILEACVKVLEHLCDDRYSILSTCEVYKSTIIDGVIENFNAAMANWLHLCGTKGPELEDINFQLIDSIRKVSFLYSIVDLKKWDLWNVIFNNLHDKALEGHLDYPPDFIKFSLTTCYYNILWDLNTFDKCLDAKEATDAIVTDLKTKFQSFIGLTEYILKNSLYSCAEEAFKIFCDLLMIFGNKSSNDSSSLDGFFSSPSKKINNLLFTFLNDNVFLCTDDNLDIGVLHERRILVSSYCKLFTHRILPIYFLSDLLKHYLHSYSNFGDIIDTMISKAKELDIVDCARAMINMLISSFAELMNLSSTDDFLVEYSDLKKIAKKFSSFLGRENKNDVFLKALHQEGISFALKDFSAKGSTSHFLCNIMFFDLLQEFSYKLNSNNKSYILKILQNRMTVDLTDTNEDMQPLISYCKSLSVS